MKLVVKKFSELTATELYEILKVRAAVFVVEQNCVYQDLDDLDYRSIHVYSEKDGRVRAYLRIFEKDKSAKMVQMGRILTVERGKGLGAKVLRTGILVAKEQFGAEKIYIEAQTYAIGFYEKAGFRVTSEEFLEDEIPHVQMMLDC